jgi:hypothetical protein
MAAEFGVDADWLGSSGGVAQWLLTSWRATLMKIGV